LTLPGSFPKHWPPVCDVGALPRRGWRRLQLRRGKFFASPPAAFRLNSGVPKERLKRTLRATFLGLVVNAALAVAKLIAGITGNSHALVADAVESIADVFGAIIV